MSEIIQNVFNLQNLLNLFMLILLQAVLGFDNLLYISLEAKRVREEKQKFVRALGIGLAVILRIVLLFVLLYLIDKLTAEIFNLDNKFIKGSFNFESLITLFGGVFILYTALKEITHMLRLDVENDHAKKKGASVAKTVTLIVIMNAVFSFDSILSAMAITRTPWMLITAIVVSGILMVWLADNVSEFLKKNRLYEVLGLFILLIVGILLLSEGGHKAHLEFFGYPVEAMSKTTFYFVIIVLAATDVIQSQYQKKLMAKE